VKENAIKQLKELPHLQKSPLKTTPIKNNTFVVYSSESDPEFTRNSPNSDHKGDSDSDNISIASTILKQEVKFRTREWSKDGTARDRYLNKESIISLTDGVNESYNEQDVRKENSIDNHDTYQEKIVIRAHNERQDGCSNSAFKNPLETPEQVEKMVDRKSFYLIF
jgi:hypothetical protein